MGGETLKRRLVHGVVLIIMALNNFVPLLKSFITSHNVLQYKAQNLNVCALLCVPKQ